jgi:hypothetical protein
MFGEDGLKLFWPGLHTFWPEPFTLAASNDDDVEHEIPPFLCSGFYKLPNARTNVIALLRIVP